MALPKTNSSIIFLIAIIFLMMGIFSGSGGTLVAAGVWFVIGLLFSGGD
ncbi:hypothetical protein SAMN05443667_1227 [Flavobacterium gillisiae]|uniref:Uncharacterized protein n=1 Tax=Flavobacterium gillisiae TaxID=150146 RepID=A0A1H4GEP4_9FLAO|nr:hypothetical protein [Flavobacterium gillisiae]SEB07358.1 hypothetical protein SAMN05443667_1227 [Flavobacterium gillisiae]